MEFVGTMGGELRNIETESEESEEEEEEEEEEHEIKTYE